MSIKTFIEGYLECALWSSTDNSLPLDDNYGIDDIALPTLQVMEADCNAFYDAHNESWDDDARAGHDFWLTRNGHGAGFWDGDYPEPEATLLTDAAHAYGPFDVYVGDDGKIHA